MMRQAEDDQPKSEVELIVGRIIMRSSALDQLIWQQISELQMINRHRHNWSHDQHAAYQGRIDGINLKLSDFHPEVDSRLKLRLRYLRRLANILTDSRDFMGSFDRIIKDINQLFVIRIDVAHASIRYQIDKGDAIVILYNWQWMIDFQKKYLVVSTARMFEENKIQGLSELNREDFLYSGGFKHYRLEYLRDVAGRLHVVECEFIKLLGSLPIDGRPARPPAMPS